VDQVRSLEGRHWREWERLRTDDDLNTLTEKDTEEKD